MHAINAWLVMAIARRAAGLSVAAAAFAGIVFALLPVHTESVAWITGRVDSMPALFYLATFLVYVAFRQRPRASTYLWSLVLFFIALFTKQNTITMVATLAAYDVIVGAPASQADCQVRAAVRPVRADDCGLSLAALRPLP